MKNPHICVLGLVCALFLSACGKPGDRVEITDTAQRTEHKPIPVVNATSEARFALAMPRPATGFQTAAPRFTGEEDAPFEFTAPEGWTEIAATQFRNPNFVIGPEGEVECYVSLLPGGGGGLLVNANRWRGQMAREAFTEAEFDRLDRAVVLDHEAVIVDFEGSFSGMGQGAAQEGYRLIGALIETVTDSVFIKMVGPNDRVEAQRDNFAFFIQSLRMKSNEDSAVPAQAVAIPENGTLPSGHPDIGAASEKATNTQRQNAPQGNFKWATPPGWSIVDHASSMRLVTYTFGDNNEGECYVVVLGGTGGGRLNNMNRWLSQMGQPPLEESELELQPRVTLLGEIVPMLISPGTYSGMGADPMPGYLLFGAAGELEDRSIFIKLVAPESLANAEFENFTLFCDSIEFE